MVGRSRNQRSRNQRSRNQRSRNQRSRNQRSRNQRSRNKQSRNTQESRNLQTPRYKRSSYAWSGISPNARTQAPLTANAPPPSPSVARPPSPAAGVDQSIASGSLVAQAFNRITEFLRMDPTRDDPRNPQPLCDRVVYNDRMPVFNRAYTRDTNRINIEPAISKLTFQCQLAHGSPTALVSDFNNPAELYKKIAQAYDGIKEDEILFCTRNTHRVEMNSIVSGTLAINDFIFAHLRGQKKEIDLAKEERLLGVTLSDNWAGRVFIRKIDPSSQLANAHPAVEVGDHIERINDESMVGKRHYQVANALRSISPGQTFTLRLISPLRSGFSFINAPKRTIAKRATPLAITPSSPTMAITDGTQTIRFKSVGNAVIETPPDKLIIDRLNDVFDNYLGFNDEELATTVFELGRDSSSVSEMEDRVKKSALKNFDFTPEFIFDLWGVVNDWKCNRVQPTPHSIKSDELEQSNLKPLIDLSETQESATENEQLELPKLVEELDDDSDVSDELPAIPAHELERDAANEAQSSKANWSSRY